MRMLDFYALMKPPATYLKFSWAIMKCQLSLFGDLEYNIKPLGEPPTDADRAHPDLNQGPADLQSAALTTELCTQTTSYSDVGTRYMFVIFMRTSLLPNCCRKASCGIRTHDLPLTERVLCQLS